MKVAAYFGDDRLRYRVVYSKAAFTECIYCGDESDTREHVPSKVFLSQPYPENLPTLPACLRCNNSYSYDELLVSLLIQRLKRKHFGDKYIFSHELNSRFEDRENARLVSRINRCIEDEKVSEFEPNIARILVKLAIGHAVWEITEGFYTDDEGITADAAKVEYSFISELSQTGVDGFLSYFVIDDEALPEVGSRIFHRIRILETHGKPFTAIVDWVNLQPTEYMYTCYKFGDEIVVKMLINSFLFAVVTLRERSLVFNI